MNRVTSMRQKKDMPEYGVKVNLHGSDCLGDWTMVGELKPYKQPPFKNAPPHRFVDSKGNRVKFVEYWSDVLEEKK